MKVEKIDHIHVIVKDMNKAINFFSEILGSKFVGPIDKGDHLIAFDSLGFELVFPKTDEPPKHLKELTSSKIRLKAMMNPLRPRCVRALPV